MTDILAAERHERTKRLIGEDGLRRLRSARVIVIGVGGVGSYAAEACIRAGIGHLAFMDGDCVAPSNLNRQLMYDETDIGRRKLEAIGEKFRRQNSKIRFIAHDRKILSEADLEEIITLDNPDIVVSAIDTPESVHDWINSVCVRHEIPYVTGGFVEDKAILGPTYVPHRTDCYNCVQRPDIANGSIRSGVGATFSAIAEYVAGKLFTEVVKILTGKLNQVAYGGKTALYDWYTNTETPVEFLCMRLAPGIQPDSRVLRKETLRNRVLRIPALHAEHDPADGNHQPGRHELDRQRGNAALHLRTHYSDHGFPGQYLLSRYCLSAESSYRSAQEPGQKKSASV